MLGVRGEVAIAATLLVGLVTDPLVDEALIDTRAGAHADDDVPPDVPAANHRPFRAGKRPLQVVARLALGEHPRRRRSTLLDRGEPALQRPGSVGAGLVSRSPAPCPTPFHRTMRAEQQRPARVGPDIGL